jgi:hypothetical protein
MANKTTAAKKKVPAKKIVQTSTKKVAKPAPKMPAKKMVKKVVKKVAPKPAKKAVKKVGKKMPQKPMKKAVKKVASKGAPQSAKKTASSAAAIKKAVSGAAKKVAGKAASMSKKIDISMPSRKTVNATAKSLAKSAMLETAGARAAVVSGASAAFLAGSELFESLKEGIEEGLAEEKGTAKIDEADLPELADEEDTEPDLGFAEEVEKEKEL